MIEISETTAFMLYLCLSLGPVLAIWAYHHYSRRHKKINHSAQQLFVCEYCHYCYLESISQRVTRCPQCQSFNE